MPFFEQLKRRNVIRIGAAYLAVSWLLVQIAETLLPIFDYGNGPIRILVIVLAIGFLPALILSWLFELTPAGIKRDEDVDHDQPASVRYRERLNQVVMVSLVLAVSYFAIDKFIMTGAEPAAVADEVSIAVMPFINMSESDEMAFFSDGVAEDILGLLSQVEGLRCVSRSSSFALRDREMAAAELGQQLGVSHVLTGSLRSQGEQIRLSVRLAATEDGTLVWSGTYNEHLDDVFAIQDEISRGVVTSIAPTLTAGLVPSAATDDTMDYVDYLRARHIYVQGRDAGNVEQVMEAKAIYEELLLRNPSYARAHAGLADVWSTLAIMGEVERTEAYPRAREAAERALDLDDTTAEAWYALGDIYVEYFWDHRAAANAYASAIKLAPQDADGLRGYAYFLRQSGQAEAAIAVYEETLKLDPLSTRGFQGQFLSYVQVGRYEQAEELVRRLTAGMPNFPVAAVMVQAYEAQGEFDKIGAVLPDIAAVRGPVFEIYYNALYERHRGNVDAGDAMILEILDFRSIVGIPNNMIVARYFATFGDNDTALQYLDRAAAEKEIGLGEILFAPGVDELKKDPRFWAWIDRAGIVPLD